MIHDTAHPLHNQAVSKVAPQRPHRVASHVDVQLEAAKNYQCPKMQCLCLRSHRPVQEAQGDRHFPKRTPPSTLGTMPTPGSILK